MVRRGNCELKFHNVGQGLFYSGNLKLDGETKQPFNFVYDCGALYGEKKWLTDAIHDYKRLTKYINLLMLSHFDEDHINGLDLLLTEVTVDTVLIPYFTFVDRLRFGLKNSLANSWY